MSETVELLKVYPDARIAVVAGVTYRWCGGLGAVIISNERRVQESDLRKIGTVVFIASTVTRKWFSCEVWWVPVGDFDADWVRRFRSALFL